MALVGWAGQNEMKKPWDRDPELAEMARNGLPVNNIMSEPDYAKAARFRRLMGPPFARKFLFDLDEPVKMCTKRMIEKIEELRTSQDGIVELMNEFTHYSFDALSTSTSFHIGLMASRLCIWRLLQRRRSGARGQRYRHYQTSHSQQRIFLAKLSQIIVDRGRPVSHFLQSHTTYPVESVGLAQGKGRISAGIPNLTCLIDLVQQISERSINAYKENVKLGSRKDSLGALIAARDEDGVGLSHQDLVGAGCVLLVAGIPLYLGKVDGPQKVSIQRQSRSALLPTF